jgi:hypothetical protein
VSFSQRYLAKAKKQSACAITLLKDAMLIRKITKNDIAKDSVAIYRCLSDNNQFLNLQSSLVY